MNPRIVKVIDAEMIRDGGSLSATLLSDKGIEYHLFTKVNIEVQESSVWIRQKYENTIIFKMHINEGKNINWEEVLG